MTGQNITVTPPLPGFYAPGECAGSGFGRAHVAPGSLGSEHEENLGQADAAPNPHDSRRPNACLLAHRRTQHANPFCIPPGTYTFTASSVGGSCQIQVTVTACQPPVCNSQTVQLPQAGIGSCDSATLDTSTLYSGTSVTVSPPLPMDGTFPIGGPRWVGARPLAAGPALMFLSGRRKRRARANKFS